MTKLDLKKFPKWKILHNRTPIHYAKNLSKLIGVDVYIKRDDLSDIGLGGNKLRKLEYLLGEAKTKHATHILTLGATQSNHARLTAVAASVAGFEVELFLKKSVPIFSTNYLQNGNILLERIIHSKNHYIENDSYVQAHVDNRMEEIRKQGGKPYFIPIGGSNSLGTLGYLDAYFEIIQQLEEINIPCQHIALATGSGGTHAGLLLGNQLMYSPMFIHAYNVQPEEDELIIHTRQISKEAAALIGFDKLDDKAIQIVTEYSGSAYGIPEDYHIHAIKLLARLDGIYMDPVYTGKAFCGLLTDIEKGKIKKGEKVLFIHTGGLPGLFAYDQEFR